MRRLALSCTFKVPTGSHDKGWHSRRQQGVSGHYMEKRWVRFSKSIWGKVGGCFDRLTLSYHKVEEEDVKVVVGGDILETPPGVER